jgi:hypothetical protein
MTKQPWEVPEPPKVGDATQDVTFRAVGNALSSWEWFEGNLSLAFSFLVGAGYGNIAALRAYGSVETFRGRAQMIERAAEVYFKHNNDETTERALEDVLKSASQFVGRRNDIAHGIVQPLFELDSINTKTVQKGFVLYPAFYATRKRKLIEGHQLNETSTFFTIEPTYIYSSNQIDNFATQFALLATRAIEVLTSLAGREQVRIAASMRK